MTPFEFWHCNRCNKTVAVPKTDLPKICECGNRSDSKPTQVYRPSPVIHQPAELPNIWPEIHQRFADAIVSGKWNGESEKRWHDEDWSLRIPQYGCSCQSHWAELSPEIDWSTAESAFESIWRLHNLVSERHSNRPQVSYEYCRSLYLPQSKIESTMAVTSLSPHRYDRQSECLNSWVKFGLDIAAIVEQENIDAMRDRYPQVSHWFASDGRPTINALAGLANQFGRVLVMNADIEIHGEQKTLLDKIDHGVIGIRYNFDRHWWRSQREQWGIDVFSFTSTEANSLPTLPLAIGQPVWDYWLLHHFRKSGRAWIAEPLFFHQRHDLNWTRDDWEHNAKFFSAEYGVEMDFDDSANFRRQFPYSQT